MPVWCFTFGCGSPLAQYYVEIDGVDELQARCRMVSMFSQHWASCYPRAGFDAQVEAYGLRPLVVNRSSSVRLGTNRDEVPLDIFRTAYPWPRWSAEADRAPDQEMEDPERQPPPDQVESTGVDPAPGNDEADQRGEQ